MMVQNWHKIDQNRPQNGSELAKMIQIRHKNASKMVQKSVQNDSKSVQNQS